MLLGPSSLHTHPLVHTHPLIASLFTPTSPVHRSIKKSPTRFRLPSGAAAAQNGAAAEDTPLLSLRGAAVRPAGVVRRTAVGGAAVGGTVVGGSAVGDTGVVRAAGSDGSGQGGQSGGSGGGGRSDDSQGGNEGGEGGKVGEGDAGGGDGGALLTGVELSVGRGECVLVLGPNGAGKAADGF